MGASCGRGIPQRTLHPSFPFQTHFQSQTLQGRANDLPIMDDEAKLREVTGLAKVTQPLRG